jgi:hypothetical protein
MPVSRTTPQLALATAISAALVALAAAPAQAAEVELPAGLACPGFALGIDIDGDAPVTREFHDRDGNLVKTIAAGKGQTLTFTNLDTGQTLALKANGAVNITRPGPGGTSTVSTMGHNVLILFPSDVPPGPTTTLHVGRVVYTVDQNATFTLLSTSGRSVDICAALAQA